MEVAGNRFMSPPQYAVWVPPLTEHSSYNAEAIVYHSVGLAPQLCEQLPQQPCTLVMTFSGRSKDFALRDVNAPRTDADIRLAQCWWTSSGRRRSTIASALRPPPGLLGVLEGMQAEPGDNRPLAQWAEQVHVSERTWRASLCASWA